MDRVALYMGDSVPLRQAIDWVEYADECGFEAVWQAENRLAIDAIVPMAAYATRTIRIKIGAGVINPWTRNAALIAATFAALDELAPGRIVCGIGAWYDPLAANVGITRSKPLLAIRETVNAVRDLLAQKTLTLRGEAVNFTEFARPSDAASGSHNIPLYIGATGPKLLALAGEIADGVLLNYLVSPAYTAEAMSAIEAGARVGGRTIEAIDRPQLIVVSLNADRKKALDAARGLVARYIGAQPAIMAASGVDSALIEEIGAILAWPPTDEQLERAIALVPDDVVQLVTATGTPNEVHAKIRAYVASGCTCPVLYPLSGDARSVIDAFARGYSG
jgi:5,10-methylenetetrahydromethanopterin reductase